MQQFPELAARLPWLHLANLPTPLERATALESAAGFGPLWVKRDDLSDDHFGGGKPRKLELLLGEAVAQGWQRVISFGGVGSNQALATAIHGRRLGLDVVLELGAQPPSAEVTMALRAMARTGAELRLVPGVSDAERRALSALKRKGREAPWVIPVGGTSPLGNLAYVDAAFELRDQIRAGVAPAPDRIFVAGGTLGTAAGLALGLRLAGLDTQLVVVRASSAGYSNRGVLERHVAQTWDYARSLDPTLPEVKLDAGRIRLDGSELGAGYGRATEHGHAALRLAQSTEHWRLENTYTAKALAALLAQKPRGVSLLWLTQSAVTPPLSDDAGAELPASLARYLRG